MAEYIDREAARESACKDCTYRIPIFCDAGCAYPKPCHKLLSAFLEAESSDVAPVVHGMWEWFDEEQGTPIDGWERDWGWRCSTCKDTLNDEYDDPDNPPKHNYCPKCGAKMDGGEKPNE